MAESRSSTFFREGRDAENRKMVEHVKELRMLIVRAIPNLIDILNPGTFRKRDSTSFSGPRIFVHFIVPGLIQASWGISAPVRKAASPFCGFSIDELLGAVYRKAETFRVYSESIKDSILTETHNMTRDIGNIAQNNHKGIEELRRKVEEVLRGQEDLRSSFEPIYASGKNHLFQFLMEHGSKLGKRVLDSDCFSHLLTHC